MAIMLIAKVVGNLWSTKKNERMHAIRLLIVQPLDAELKPHGNVLVAADEIGAGKGEQVLVSQGSPAMMAFADLERPLPIDAVVVGIIDSLEMAKS